MLLSKRVILAATLALAASIPAGTAFADTELNIVPHGNEAPGVPWASAPGILPADTQAKMYDRITPLFRDITDDVLKPSTDGTGYYKSAALLPESSASFVTSENVGGTSPSAGAVSARIKRDTYGVPHIYSDTDAGAIFGAGYAVATDQSLLLNQARYNGVAGLIDMPGVPAINLVLGLYDYKPSAKVSAAAEKLQTAAIEKQGAQGKQLLNDIDTYLAGINARMQVAQPTSPKFTRIDLYALNAIKSQFLGEGGGQEVDNALFLDQLRSKLGTKKGDGAFEDLRARNDPEATYTTSKSAKLPSVSVSKPSGMVRLKSGSFKNSYIKLPDAKASAAAAHAANTGKRQLASNILIVSGSKSATGKPLFVGGPQIGFNYPGLTMEMQLTSPSINVEGVTSAPFPGYMLIGHGVGYAWSLTSAGADIIDTYAEKLCGGSKTKYSYKGKCLKMEKVEAGTIGKVGGSKTSKATFYRTIHGPVIGYATDRSTGKQVALSQKRSSYGRETVDQLFNQQMTYSRVHSAKDFINAAAKSPQTFNSFYASATESAFYTSGAIPTRPKGVNGDLPVDGSGKYEWTGELAKAKHPQVTNPSSGMIVNWNNKPAKDFPAGDDRFGNEGGIQRVDMLNSELARYPKATLANVLAAANAGATEDVRITQLWPTLKAMLAKGKAPDAQSTALVARLDAWYAAGGSRVDRNLDGNVDDPGAVILDTAWKGLTDAGLCDRLGSGLCKSLEGRISRFDLPPGGQYSGWHQYMDKDLRTLLKKKVAGKYHLTYCGDGSVSKCSSELWSALAKAGKSIAAKQGADPSKWTEKAATISFSPLPLTTFQYTNKPTGIHQVMAFGQ
ncbi:penicillin acylase family protein [Baekduia sp. Peel2402]|uniref:penicillin acylase family protein n=1 Tax=Baekduia sp. Peel2402 TaxID=3458296 RepID=UPI00403E9E06